MGRVGEENIQDLKFNIVVEKNLNTNKERDLEPTSLTLQWWLNVSMTAFNLPSNLPQMETFNLPSNLPQIATFNLPSNLLQICSQTTSKPTQSPSKDK